MTRFVATLEIEEQDIDFARSSIEYMIEHGNPYDKDEEYFVKLIDIKEAEG